MALEPSHVVLQPGPTGWPLGARQALLQGLLAANGSHTHAQTSTFIIILFISLHKSCTELKVVLGSTFMDVDMPLSTPVGRR